MQSTAPSTANANLINWHRFHEAMCESVCPWPAYLFDEACVIGKRYPDADETASPVMPLTPNDVEILEEILFKLPMLRGDMPQAAKDDFLRKYRGLADRPSWEPVLRTAQEQTQLAHDSIAFSREHMARTNKWVKNGKLRLVDSTGTVTLRAVFSSYIFKDEALKYLKLCGIELVDPIFQKLGFAPGSSLSGGSKQETAGVPESTKLTDEALFSTVPATQKTNLKFPPISAVTTEFVRTDQAAHYLNREPQTLRGWASRRDGPLEPKHSGRLLVWAVADIRKLLL